MLVLSRKKGEIIDIGGGIEVKVVEIGTHNIRLGISAPGGVKILRREIVLELAAQRIDPFAIEEPSKELATNQA